MIRNQEGQRLIKQLDKATSDLQAINERNKYHDKKYPVTIISRVTEAQAAKLGDNKSEVIRSLIDQMP